MTFTPPQLLTEPDEIRVGEAKVWTKALSFATPAQGVLKYSFQDPVNNKSLPNLLIATDNGDGTFLCTMTSALSAQFTLPANYSGQPPEWRWQAYFYPTGTTDKYLAAYGRIRIRPSYDTLAGGNGVDDREHIEVALAAIEAVIAGKASQDQMAYTIHGRSLTRMTHRELTDFRKEYKRQLSALKGREQAENGLNPRNKIVIRF